VAAGENLAVGELFEGAAEDFKKIADALDEGALIGHTKMSLLDVAADQGWPVARKMEEVQKVMDLPDDVQALVKRAKKALKEEESSKKERGSGRGCSRSGLKGRGGYGRSFGPAFAGGFGGFGGFGGG
jgi:hypothetical protein